MMDYDTYAARMGFARPWFTAREYAALPGDHVRYIVECEEREQQWDVGSLKSTAWDIATALNMAALDFNAATVNHERSVLALTDELHGVRSELDMVLDAVVAYVNKHGDADGTLARLVGIRAKEVMP
jgi:hypothetical protein